MEKSIKKQNGSKSAINMFFSGVVILTIANIMVKSVGLISKIVLNRVVMSQGAGYYSSAYEIYAYLYVISTSGLPVALSIMVSKSRAKGRFKEASRIFNISMVLFLAIGTVLSVLMAVFSSEIASFLKSEETALCILAISPTMLFICLSSCMRGYFQGYQLMGPTAVSQFIEACVKVAIIVLFSLWAKSKGYPDYVVAAYAILGVTVGVLCGMIYLYIRKLFFKEKKYNYEYAELENSECRSVKEILKELIVIAIPITISSSVLSLTTILDTLMVQRRLLSYGMNETMVKMYYGDYTTLVISMFNLPTILLYPIANALVPLISASYERKDEESTKNMRALSIRIIMLIAFPCAVGLGVFAHPILELLMFRADSVERSAPWLSIAAISVVFLGLIAATNAFLNTAGHQRLPIISMVTGAVVKLISNYVLLGKIGIYGAPISTVLCYLSASSMNIFFTVKYIGKLPDIKKSFLMPFFISVVSVGSSAIIYILLSTVIPSRISTVIAIFTAVILYILLVIKTKTVSKSEIEILPSGEKISKILQKIKVLS